MKILFLIESAETGGAEQVVLQLAKGFIADGHLAKVLTLEEGWLTEALDAEGIERELVLSERKFDISLPFRLAKIAKRFSADVIHSHLLDSNFYGSLAAKIAGINHVATDHGDVHLPEKKRFLELKLKTLSFLGSQVTAVSNYTVNRMVELGTNAGRTSCVYNPLVVDVVNPSEFSHELRAEHGLAEETWIWFQAAMLFPVKDQQTLIRAFAESQKNTRSPQALMIAGEGGERASLEALIKELGVGESVFLLGYRGDVPKLLSAANGFVLSSLSESMPMSILEAAAYQKVIVSSDVGGVAEVVLDGKRGYLFQAGDAAGLTQRMSWVLENQAEALKTAREANVYVEESFALASILGRYQELYSI